MRRSGACRIAGTGAALGEPTPAAVPRVTEREVRATLKGQIARLERELAELLLSACPRVALPPASGGATYARMPDVAELERMRDLLVERVQDLRRRLDERAAEQEENRELLEAAREDPAKFRWLRLGSAAIGEPGCTEWRSRPRMGILGMLMGWWEVKISSGCP